MQMREGASAALGIRQENTVHALWPKAGRKSLLPEPSNAKRYLAERPSWSFPSAEAVYQKGRLGMSSSFDDWTIADLAPVFYH